MSNIDSFHLIAAFGIEFQSTFNLKIPCEVLFFDILAERKQTLVPKGNIGGLGWHGRDSFSKHVFNLIFY